MDQPIEGTLVSKRHRSKDQAKLKNPIINRHVE
jgi:hypothetical protein